MKRLVLVGLVACGARHRPPPPGEALSPPPPIVVAIDAGPAEPPVLATAPSDAGAPPPPAPPPPVRIENIGMHVAGGPYDEATKVPFRSAVSPHYPEMARCWAEHVPHPPKSTDVGVDLLIEPGGGHPKVSHPRSNLAGSGPGMAAETKGFLPCVVAVFESVDFPALDRGRTGVSYSLRFSTATARAR